MDGQDDEIVTSDQLARIRRIMEDPYEDLSELSALVEDESEDGPDQEFDSIS